MSEQQQGNPPATDEQILAAGFDIPVGTYKGRGIEGSDQQGTSDKGNDEVSLELSLVDLGRTVTAILSFSENAAPYSLDKLRALGWQDGSESLAGISKNEVLVSVRYELYQGAVKMKVDIVVSRFSFKNPMGEQEKRGFFSKLNELAKKQQGRAPKAAAAPAAAGGGTPGAPGGSYPENWDAPDPTRAPINL